MNMLLIGISLYLTYYTFAFAQQAWKEGNIGAGLVIGLMSGSYVPLSVYLYLR